MKNALFFFGLIVLSTIESVYADENIKISAQQIQALGITTGILSGKQTGEVPGLPAQVVIPSNQLFVISAPLPAMIEQILVDAGDRVKKGQVIATLQSPALAEAQRGLLQSGVQNRLAQENLARDESLYKDGIISESRYRTTRGLALEAHAALSERKQMLRLAGLSDNAISQLQTGNMPNSLLTLTSPTDGVVLEKNASAAQRIAAAVPVFKIARLTSLILEIQAPLSVTHDFRIGADISVPAYSASGKLTAIGSSLTGTNQTILLRGIITEGSNNLRPGQFVEASISTHDNSTAQWEIPNSAISHIDGRTLIFVKTPQGFRAQKVVVMNEGDRNSVISGNLKRNEVFAISGVSALKSAMMGIGGVQ